MNRSELIANLLINYPNGLQLKEIVHKLYGDDVYDASKAWSNYIGTYQTIRNARHLFARVQKGTYVFRPENTAPDFSETTLEELILEVLKPGELLRCNEICNRILELGTSVSYKSIFQTLINSSMVYKVGIHYQLVEKIES